jgi:hypothetical protein
VDLHVILWIVLMLSNARDLGELFLSGRLFLICEPPASKAFVIDVKIGSFCLECLQWFDNRWHVIFHFISYVKIVLVHTVSRIPAEKVIGEDEIGIILWLPGKRFDMTWAPKYSRYSQLLQETFWDLEGLCRTATFIPLFLLLIPTTPFVQSVTAPPPP